MKCVCVYSQKILLISVVFFNFTEKSQVKYFNRVIGNKLFSLQ